MTKKNLTDVYNSISEEKGGNTKLRVYGQGGILVITENFQENEEDDMLLAPNKEGDYELLDYLFTAGCMRELIEGVTESDLYARYGAREADLVISGILAMWALPKEEAPDGE